VYRKVWDSGFQLTYFYGSEEFHHPATLEVKLTDLGVATRLPREQQPARPPQLIEGTLPYMSPEQTGGMNRAVDSRTDLYSLGVTFYQMLTGRLPFEARDPLEWIHCHVARVPASPSELVPEVPESVERIVMKLLAKMADDRYQTARGLERDLMRCLEQWRSRGRIEPFTLGERDIPDRLQIPQKLYGRAEQVAALLRAFERVVETGSPELVLVSGYSGIGKSSLVHELQKPIVGRRGAFVAGKFDQYSRDPAGRAARREAGTGPRAAARRCEDPVPCGLPPVRRRPCPEGAPAHAVPRGHPVKTT
jgi:serine/threonine protein kinase